MEMAFLAPNLYRDTRHDRDGNVRSVEIVDTVSKKTLHLDMKAKKATWKRQPTNQYGPGKPFDRIAEILKNALSEN